MKDEKDYASLIAKAADFVDRCRDELSAARVQSEDTRRTETARLNAFNRSTKEFDELLKEFKAKAPNNTDWKRPETRSTK